MNGRRYFSIPSKIKFHEKKSLELPWDSDYLLLWHGQRWRVATGGFVLWLADVVVGATRDIPNFEQWLNEQEMLGYLLTRKQWETGRALMNQVPKSVISQISNMFWQSAGLPSPENQ